MSNLTQSIVCTAFGIALGGVALAAVVEPTSEAAEIPAPVAAQQALTAQQVEPVEEAPAPSIEIGVESAKAFGRDGAVLGRFEVQIPEGALSGTTASRAKLHIEPTGDMRVVDVFGSDWTSSGDGVEIGLGDLQEGSEHTFLVEFVDGASRDVRTRLTYYGGERGAHVTGAKVDKELTRSFTSPEMEVTVRRELSRRAMSEAKELMEKRDFGDALASIDDALGWNAEVGMALRVSDELTGEQSALRALRKEVEEAKKPKKRIRRPQKPKIEIFRGDRHNG